MLLHRAYAHTRLAHYFKPSVLSLAVALTATGNLAHAQTDADAQNPLEEVVVTGFRASVITATEEKRRADTIVEAISADDLGVLPDTSIGDALSRLPGVTLLRAGGQSGSINIRGLAGEFVHTTLNGREQTATSGSRTVEFDQYPTELISAAAVYKSPKASLIEGGVAGTVELKTVNPLDNDRDHIFNINARGSYNDRASDVVGADNSGYRFSASYQGKFANDTLGLAVGYSRLFQPHVNTQFVGFNYTNQRDLNGDGVDEFLSEGFELQQKGGDETRDGYMATLQWEPTDNFTLKADLFYSEFDSEAFARGFRVKTLNNATIDDPTIESNGAVTGGEFTYGDDYFTIQTTNDDESRYRDILSGGLNAEWRQGPWTLALDVSRSEASHTFSNGVSWGILYEDIHAAVPETDKDLLVRYQLNGLGLPDIYFANAENYTDLDKMGLGKLGIYPFEQKDVITAYKADVNFEFYNNSLFSSVDFGVRYSDRHFRADRAVFEYGHDFGLNATATPDQPPLALTPDVASIVQWGGKFAGYPNFLSIDPDKVLRNNGIEPRPIKDWNHNWTLIQSGDVYEEVLAGYVQLNLSTEIFDLPLTGNIGLRIVDSDQRSTGLQQLQGAEAGTAPDVVDGNGVVSNDYLPVKYGKSYTDYLPSVNLNLHLTDNDQLRFAAAKVMGRPPLDKLKAGSGSWVSDGKYNMWGNTSPLLDPFYATQFDLSYEHYFSETHGSFVVAYFYKDIESFIEETTIFDFDFAGNGIVVPTDPATGLPYGNGEYQTADNNKEGGWIQGIELAYNQTFDFLPGAWSGLGASASYSYTDSEIELTIETGGNPWKATLPGLAPHVFTGTLFYDYNGFSTRLSLRYRDAFVAKELMAENPLDVYYGEETMLDYQASYAFDNGLSVLFQVNNLTDEPQYTYFGNERQTGNVMYFGRQMFLGVNYSF